MREVKAKIVSNRKIAPLHYKLALDAPPIAKDIMPGQFMHVKCSDSYEPLLRRPFSLHKVKDRHIEVLYEVVGRGTELLAKKKSGEFLDIIGPLGNGFSFTRMTHDARRRTVLVAGGMGVAPLLALAEKLVRGKSKLYVLIGAKTKDRILCEKDFKKLGCEVKIATDDGSKGFKGLVTDLLRQKLLVTGIYACGPNAMLKEVARIAQKHNVQCQVSLEEYMACGVGVCLGCPVKVKMMDEGRRTKDEYKMVCKDGPVFNAEEIIW